MQVPPLSTANVEALAKLSTFIYDSTTPVLRSPRRSSSTTCNSSLAPSYPSSPTLEGGVKLAALRGGQGKRRHSESVDLNMSMLDVDQAQQGTLPSIQRRHSESGMKRRHSETATLGGGSSHMAQECLRAASMARLENQLGVGLLLATFEGLSNLPSTSFQHASRVPESRQQSSPREFHDPSVNLHAAAHTQQTSFLSKIFRGRR